MTIYGSLTVSLVSLNSEHEKIQKVVLVFESYIGHIGNLLYNI